MEFKIGDSIKRPHWDNWSTVVEIKPGQYKVVGHIPGYNHPLWYNADLFEWEKKPNAAKIGDAITVVPHPDGNYFVASVAENGHTVKLQHANGMIAHGIYNLKEFPKWSINGVPCQEFFGNAAQETAPPPVDVPQRKKRIYNA